ncbi:hypothetical protein HT102_06420 [Hoyosella sp. G463]|uniref:Uncharacterized protein n=1 Tax=Lolliginicoccus lacisalsi TaxID=2742202 RepID=A0A927JBN1_9ACTN|nr:hypothetical protein [Lolliginicoccus lacisalsi]MBD8506113.1 hypothetical protein [Lolliginicoccus lacisalsi]
MSSPITSAGGLLELDPATLDRAITACEQLATDLVRARNGRIRTFPSASLRLGTLPSAHALARAYGALWDGGEASLDGIVTSHVSIAEAMAATLASARDQLTGTDREAAAALAELEALAKQGGTGAVLAKSLLPSTDVASTGQAGTGPIEALAKQGGTGAVLAKSLLAAAAAVFNLSPRSPGYHALPVAVTEPFGTMGHAEIAAAATALAADLDSLMNFADSWKLAATGLTEAAEDAAAGLRVLPGGLSGELADRMIAAIEDHLVSLVTLGSVADEIGGKLDITVQGLSDAARAVPEVPTMSAADVADPTGASQARLAAEQQAALELARDAMELRYRPVVNDAADRVPLLPSPDVPTSGDGAVTAGPGIAPQAGSGPGTGERGPGGAGSGASGSGGAAADAGSSLAAGSGEGAPGDARLGHHSEPTTLPAGTQPAGLATAGGEASTAPRPGTGAGPGMGAGAVAGPGGQPGAAGAGGPAGGALAGGPVSGGGASRGIAQGASPSGPGRPPSSSGGTARLPGGSLPPTTTGAATTAPSAPGTNSRPMMGGMAPMAPMAGGGAAGGQGHTPASYLTSKRNGRALIGDLPRTPRIIISGSDDIFEE